MRAGRIPRKDDPSIHAQAEASIRAGAYSDVVASRTERPLTTALGWRLPRRLLDVGPVAFILFIGLGAVAFAPDDKRRIAVLLALGVIASAGALLLRHRSPLVVLGVVLTVSVVVGYGPIVVLPVLLAVFTVAEYSDRPKVIVATAVTAIGLIATDALHASKLGPGTILSHLVAVGMAVAVGLYLRARADYINGLRDRAERLERERELLALQAVGDERVRIARELHDVVAHNVSLMVVQSQALAATGPTDAQRGSLATIADLGREALSEMHRMLGVLRIDNGGSPDREPQPGVKDLPKLVVRTRQAGVDASLDVVGERHELPPGVDLSAYRIVQEALTNVVRHAHATEARVVLCYKPGAIELTVTDNGSGQPAPLPADGPGHGLVGMRERVALFGGDLSAGRRFDASGFVVRASLPVG
jgi:signal transduction histidine kinase